MTLNSKLNNRGFTLVELLTSIIVLVAVGSVIVGITTSSLRGANKTTVVENIRQNGNYALSQISKDIEYAQIFNGLSDNGIDYVTSCVVTSPITSAVTKQYSFIKITPLNTRPIVYNCNSSVLTANKVSLIDTSSLSLKDCSIKCTQTRSTDVPIIGISFTLESKNTNSGLIENSSAPILFETSVTIRNYKR